MIRTLAVERYRSLDELVLGLDRLTVVTGANGSGKTSVYRVLRLLADIVRDGAISSLAREGGMRSAIHAGPRPKGPVAVRLGVATEDLSYAIDLGLPQMGPVQARPGDQVRGRLGRSGAAPVHDPHRAHRDAGPQPRRRRDVARRAARRSASTSPSWPCWRTRRATPDLFALREQARRWRFYDHLRTDADAPARRPGVATFTPVLSPGGDDLAAALLTIGRVGDDETLQACVDAAFPGSEVVVDEDEDGTCRVGMTQPGLLRPLSVAELSDGTLTYLLLLAACLATRAPDLLVLNEPESSLHPSLMPAVGALIASASERSQVLVVTHSGDLVRALRAAGSTTVELSKNGAATTVAGRERFDGPPWTLAEALTPSRSADRRVYGFGGSTARVTSDICSPASHDATNPLGQSRPRQRCLGPEPLRGSVSAPSTDAAPLGFPETGKGLKGGALGLVSSVVVGTASTAPAYSLAASLGFVVAGGGAILAGVKAPAIILLAFVPMYLIAVAYQELNRAEPDCGTTFTWAPARVRPDHRLARRLGDHRRRRDRHGEPRADRRGVLVHVRRRPRLGRRRRPRRRARCGRRSPACCGSPS